MGFDFMLEEIQQTIDEIPKGQIFYAKSLIKGAEWDTLTRGDKLKFGKWFKQRVNQSIIVSVRYCGKADNNSALYEKL